MRGGGAKLRNPVPAPSPCNLAVPAGAPANSAQVLVRRLAALKRTGTDSQRPWSRACVCTGAPCEHFGCRCGSGLGGLGQSLGRQAEEWSPTLYAGPCSDPGAPLPPLNYCLFRLWKGLGATQSGAQSSPLARLGGPYGVPAMEPMSSLLFCVFLSRSWPRPHHAQAREQLCLWQGRARSLS